MRHTPYGFFLFSSIPLACVTFDTHHTKAIVLLYLKNRNMGFLSNLLGNKTEKISDFIERGAIIIDVRTPGEYNGGAIPGSKNIPLQNLLGQVANIKKLNKPVITCCASGMRSASAATILKNNGIEAINGGGYASLYGKLK